MAFYSDEYKHVLLVERVMSEILEEKTGKLSELASCGKALIDAVRLKRDMRGIPDPKPVEVNRGPGKRKRFATINVTPVSLPAPSPDAAQAPPNAPESTPGPQ